MSEPYRSNHRYLAAYLIGKSFPLIAWKLQDGYVEFSFEENESLQESVRNFYANSGEGAPILPQDFIQGLEQVKNIIRDQKPFTSTEEEQRR